MVRGWWLPVLDLEAYGRDFVVNRGQLPPVLSLEQLGKRSGHPQA